MCGGGGDKEDKGRRGCVHCAGRMEERRIREEEDMWGGGGEADKGRRGYVGRRRRKGFVLRRCGKAGG